MANGEQRIHSRSYQDLEVWQSAISLAELTSKTTSDFPKSEMYGLTSQMRRSSVSIAANIAEGYGRETTPAFIQFLRIAQGSVKEFETHLIIAQRVGHLTSDSAEPMQTLCASISRMLRGLIRSLEAKLTSDR